MSTYFNLLHQETQKLHFLVNLTEYFISKNVPIREYVMQNESKVKHSTLAVFYIAVLTILKTMFNKKPHENWFVNVRGTSN